ncbi:MAG: hypothetical protein LBN39_07635 [Planctomycetaceae bacterium]|nr:hypothetical protein [Planctomycetaceae bacterium]
MWLDDEKTNLLAATHQNPKRTKIGTISSSNTTVYQDFYLEGVLIAGNDLTANAEAFQGTTRKSSYDGNESTYLFDPVVDLDIDSDNNGYINDPDKNKLRSDAEDKMEEQTAKPITFIPSAVESLLDLQNWNNIVPLNNYEVPDDYVYVPLRVKKDLGNLPSNEIAFSFHYTMPNLRVYKKTTDGYELIPSNPLVKISAIQLKDTYYVKAVSNATVTEFASGYDKIHLVMWKQIGVNQYEEVKRDTVSLKVQDGTLAPAWIVPSG